MAKEPKVKKNFFKDFKAELKKVIWPTPKQIVNSTIAVITIVLITAVIVFVLDLAFDTFNNLGINKIKEKVSNSTTQNEENETSEDNSTDENTTEQEGTDTDNNTENETNVNE